MKPQLCLAILVCTLALQPPAAAAAKRPFLPEDQYALREAATPDISPDGKLAAFTVTTHSRPFNRDIGAVWLVPLDASRAAHPLTDADLSSTRPAWRPDGKAIAFLSTLRAPNEGGATQVWLVPLDGGEPRQLTHLKTGVREFHWSPDGSRLLCVAAVGPDPGPKQPDASDTRRLAHILYKRDGRGFFDDRRDHLWVVDVASGAARQITEGDWDDRQPEWSPDGRRIAFVSDRSGHAFDTSQTTDIWIVGADGSALRDISAAVGKVPQAPWGSHGPHWSPDGARISFLAANEKGGRAGIWIAPADGATPARAAFQDDYLFTEYDTDPQWRGDGLYYTANDHGSQQVFRGDLASGKAMRLTAGDRFRSDLTVDRAGRGMVFTANDFDHPAELYAADADGRHERQLTQLNQPVLDGLELAPLTRVTGIRAADGLPIDGFLAKPVGWRPDRTYPLVLLIHGGPSNMFGFGWTQHMQALTGQGYAVFYANPRGSSGYGFGFIRAVDREWGGKAYTDIMTALDAVLAQNPWIDRGRLGVSGSSYGGFMTNWIIGHTDRFAAAVPIASISNLISVQGTRDEAFGHARDFGGDVFQNYDLYWAYSPLRFAPKVRTPTLILHGEVDQRVPLEQPEQWFRALRHFGVPSEMVIFPREHHTLYATGEPKHVVEAMRWEAYWFDRYLNRNSNAAPPPP